MLQTQQRSFVGTIARSSFSASANLPCLRRTTATRRDYFSVKGFSGPSTRSSTAIRASVSASASSHLLVQQAQRPHLLRAISVSGCSGPCTCWRTASTPRNCAFASAYLPSDLNTPASCCGSLTCRRVLAPIDAGGRVQNKRGYLFFSISELA